MKSFRSVVMNCRSVSNKVDHIMDLLISYSISFAFLSETWLPNDSNPHIALIERYGFDCYHSDSFGRGKGCAVLVASKVSSLTVNYTSFGFQSFEAIAIDLNDLMKTKLICVYRPPRFGSAFNFFLDDFREFSSNLVLNGSNFIMGGDFNIHWNISGEHYTYRFKDLLDELGLQVTAPTVPTHNRGNTLDLIISNISISSHITLQSVECDLLISDHYPIIFDIELITHAISLPPKVVQRRNCKNVDSNLFNNDLALNLSENFPEINSSSSLLSTLSKFSEILDECLDVHAPLESMVIKPKSSDVPPWIDGEYRIERSKRRRFEKRYKSTLSTDDWNLYKLQSLLCRKMVRLKRQSSYDDTFLKIGTDQKSLFKFVNNISESKKTRKVKLPNNFSDPTGSR